MVLNPLPGPGFLLQSRELGKFYSARTGLAGFMLDFRHELSIIIYKYMEQSDLKHTRLMQFIGIGIGTLLAILLLGSCQAPKKTAAGHQKATQPVQLQQLVNGGDTTLLLNALKGTWHLDRTCLSSFTGLKCDSSIQQDWLVDSLGGISWEEDGQQKLSDQIHFVKRAGRHAGLNKSDSVWVLYLTNTQRGYLIQDLQRDSLKLANYPLIMDATTSYDLHRKK